MCVLSEATIEEQQKVVYRLRLRTTVNEITGCWDVPKGSKTSYPRVNFKTQHYYSHRASHIIHHGEIEPGNVVMHSCDNEFCWNPDHLSQGTQQDNVDDMVAKGRCRRAKGLYNGNALTKERVLNILSDYYINGIPNITRLSDMYGHCRGTIRQIINGQTYKSVFMRFQIETTFGADFISVYSD